MIRNRLVLFLLLDLIFIGAFAFWYTSVRNDPDETTLTEIVDEVAAESRNYSVVRDQVYKDPVDSQRQILDVYQPKEVSDASQPIVVWVHGGGWVAGDKNDEVPVQPLIDAGYIVASINYRYASDAPHPVQVNDLNAAVAWLRDNAAEYNIDPGNVALMGFSAGGHIAALAGFSANSQAFEQPQAVQAVVALAAPVDLVNFEADFTTLFNASADQIGNLDAAKVLLNCATEASCQNALRDASPITYVDAQDPPGYVQHGSADSVVPITQANRFGGVLQSNVDGSVVEIMPDVGHDYEVNQNIIDFLTENLR